MKFISLRSVFAALLLCVLAPNGYAHSGKARFHAIIDTDAAADDLRTLCMLLGNREIEVLAVTTSEGALTPHEAAERVRALLNGFHHEGVPVGAGRPVGAPVPEWRAHSERVNWGDSTILPGQYPFAQDLIAGTIDNEEERIVFIALGPLTNLDDVLQARPELKKRIDRVVWYNDRAKPLAGANYITDKTAAKRVLASGIPVTVLGANPTSPVIITPALIDSIAAIPNAYARKIVETHRTAPLALLIDRRHLEAWDDLAAVWLFAPELFTAQQKGERMNTASARGKVRKRTLRPLDENVEFCTLRDPASAAQAEAVMVAILRGKPDSESKVFYGFPVQHDLYAPEVIPIIDQTIERHGPGEWRAGVLTNELHGHLGIYATIGVKMGIRAREYFNIGVDDIVVTSYAGHNPPVSCMNDGLQVSTGGTVGHGLISVVENEPVRPEARFSFKGKTLRLKLKPEYAARIRADVQQGIERYGNLTEPYWEYVKALALKYWRDFDRHEIFEMYVEEADGTSRRI